jgi:hypothetical protein
MDLSVYISELLNEQGTINIPQIGVFKQVRMRGHYNADEGKLYPPYFQTEFEQKPVEDDSLLQYITQKSKVSATSAKYFMDRYLFNILQQAEIGEVMLGRLGWIAKEGDTINFRPAPAVTANVAAFGFAPVSVNAEPASTETAPEPVPAVTEAPKITEAAQTPVYSVEKTSEVINAHEAKPKVAPSPLVRQSSPQPVAPVTPPAAAIEDPRQVAATPVETVPEAVPPFYVKPWFFALVAAAIVIILIIVLYPLPEDKSTASKVNVTTPSMDSVVVKQPIEPVKDTTVKTTPVQGTDTTANKPLPASTEFAPNVEAPATATVPTLVNTNNYKFVLMSGAFSNATEAIKVVNRYKAIGVEAAILKNISPSKYVKVTLGFFKTYAEGQAAKIRLVKLKHLRSSDLYVETLRTKKK